MKTPFFILFLTVLLISSCRSKIEFKSFEEEALENAEFNRTIESFGLSGKVKSLKETSYLAQDKLGEISQGMKVGENYYCRFNENGMTTLRIEFEKEYYLNGGKRPYISSWKKTTYKYNSKGYLIESIDYDRNDKILTKGTYKYNYKNLVEAKNFYRQESLEVLGDNLFTTIYKYRNDKLIEKGTYRSDSILEGYGKYLYKYDSNNKLIERKHCDAKGDCWRSEYVYSSKRVKEKKYNLDGSYSGMNVSIFNRNGNLIKESFYNSENKIDFIEIYKYDKDDNLIEEGRKSKYEDHHNWKYIYDDKGNEVKYYRYNINSDITFKIIYKYEFDNNDNWIKKTSYETDLPKNITIREIEYFE